MPVTLEIAPARAADAQIIAEMSRRLVEIGLPWTWTPARVARHLQHPESLALPARPAGTKSPCDGSPWNTRPRISDARVQRALRRSRARMSAPRRSPATRVLPRGQTRLRRRSCPGTGRR